MRRPDDAFDPGCGKWLLVVLAVLALLGLSAATALGSADHRNAVLGATDAFVSEQLRVPIPQRADVPATPGELKAGWAGVPCADITAAHYDPPLLEAMAGRADINFEAAWAVALHEHLHMRGADIVCVYGQDWQLEPTWSYFEEGFTEAVRIDLFPAFMWRMFHLKTWDLSPMEKYAGNVATVRELSRLATGSSSWRDRGAVLWRRAGLLADWPTRQALIAAGNAARTA